ncbi:MAG: hypothetical protein MUC42_18535 [Bryobacter sp.]|nr:hypothetical protein [Bryobacter sp.]
MTRHGTISTGSGGGCPKPARSPSSIAPGTTDEDWRNRAKWEVYEEAVEEMLLKTSTRTCPWFLIEGNDKYWARVQTLEKLVAVLSRELNYKPADPLKKK